MSHQSEKFIQFKFFFLLICPRDLIFFLICCPESSIDFFYQRLIDWAFEIKKICIETVQKAALIDLASS